MSQAPELELRGCTPEPLMAYLKALGVFRIVAEQRDPTARAWWQNDTFVLQSVLDRGALMGFFLDEYKPTPIVSPWNGGSGFYPRDNSKAMNTILELESPRFRLWNEVISTGKRVLAKAQALHGTDKKRFKEWSLAQCRVEFPDDALDWLDAAYVLTAGGPAYPPLLGTGGNDGRLEFSNNFMQNVVLALNIDERRNGEVTARNQLAAALFNEGSPELVKKRSPGFFNPGGVGGANASMGFDDDSLTNPWDYVLMFEGALLFAGAAARRLSSQASSKAVFPFTVDSSAAGYGTSSGSEYGSSSRAEFWAPLWDRPANLRELAHLVSEGRAQMGRRQGSSGTDFARAVAGLGIEQGVAQFQRYGFMARNGLSYLATPLGRFYVRGDRSTSERANVLFDLDTWLERLRGQASGSSAPAGLGTVLSQVDGAIIEFCQRGRPRDLQNVLIAVGRTERWLSKSGLSRDSDKDRGIRPISGLSWDWVHHADDRSPEFRLARAMASILQHPAQGEHTVGPIRENLEPVDMRRRVDWSKDSTSSVWTAADAHANMLAVLVRRCLEGRMGGMDHPPLKSTYSAQLSDIAVFLDGGVDFGRIADLVLPLSFVRYRPPSEHSNYQQTAPFDLPPAYTALKLILLPSRFECSPFDADVDISVEPSMLAMLRAGRIGDAYRVACRRLRASGLRPLSDDPGIADGSAQGRRVAAALLFPLDESAYNALAERALRRPDRADAERLLTE